MRAWCKEYSWYCWRWFCEASRVVGYCAAICVCVMLVVGCERREEGQVVVQPLEKSPVVRRVSAEDWADLVLSGGPGGTGWVLLPDAGLEESAGVAVRSEVGFVTGVRAEERGFFGVEACRECHEEQYATYTETAHARTSMRPSESTILGSFLEGQNVLRTASEELRFRMLSVGGSFVQRVELRDGKSGVFYTKDFPIDLVLGSGNHGQSYLYWEGDHLYQLHVSYLAESDGWVNSPGPYYDGTADFARPVPARCLDCHATWIGCDVKSVNRFERDSLVLGIGCVRCHGPGHEHVEYHRQFPEARGGRRIVQPGSLSVERQNDLCAQCHSAGEPLGAAFGYRPGEPLAEWMELDLSGESEENADPHSANQLARLMQSRCFGESGGLSCVTCHDPHRSQRGATAEYSAKCADCHTAEVCPDVRLLGGAAAERCVDCHMPGRRDAQVRIETSGGNVQALLRDHRIGRWPEAAEEVRRELRGGVVLPEKVGVNR